MYTYYIYRGYIYIVIVIVCYSKYRQVCHGEIKEIIEVVG